MERERSPNYPAYALDDALEMARQAYANVKRVPVPMEAMARALGSSSLSGPARSKIAALRAYGLLESAKDGLKVSDRAMTLILARPADAKWIEAARAAVLSPTLFADLHERSGMDDEQLQFHLVRDRAFSEDGARRAIRSFRVSAALAGLNSADAVPGIAEAATEEWPVVATATVPLLTPNQPPTTRTGELVFDAPGVVSVRIAFPGGTPSAESISVVMSFLELMKPLFPPASKKPTNDEGAESTD